MEKTRIQTSGFWLIVVLLVLSGAITYTLRYLKVAPERMPDFSLIPLETGDWKGEALVFSEETYEILKATDSKMIAYQSGTNLIPVLFIGYFADQKYGSQIHSPRHCLPGSGWGILTHTHEKIEINGRTLNINRVLIGAREKRQLMYYWFQTRSGLITSEFALKFNLFLNSLLIRPTDAAFVRLTINLPQGTPDKSAEEILQSFLAVFLESIQKSLPFDTY